jgi:hypothetical protein
MQNIFLINLVIAGIVFGAMAAYLLRNDENLSKKFARIRVRINDQDRRRMPEPRQEEDYERTAPVELLLAGALLLVIVVMMQAA